MEASVVSKRLREERSRESLQSLVPGVIWGFGALTYKCALMGKGHMSHMSQLHQQSWGHTAGLSLWMEAWEGAHGLECSRKMLQEEMGMRLNLLETTGLAPYPTEMALLLLISWTLSLPKRLSSAIYNEKAGVCYEGKEFCTHFWWILAFSTLFTSSSWRHL